MSNLKNNRRLIIVVILLIAYIYRKLINVNSLAKIKDQEKGGQDGKRDKVKKVMGKWVSKVGGESGALKILQNVKHPVMMMKKPFMMQYFNMIMQLQRRLL